MWFIIVSWWVRLYELFRDDLCRRYFKTCRTLLKMSVLLQSTTQNGQRTPASFLPQRWSLFPAWSLSSTSLECCRIWLIYFTCSGLTVFCRALFLPLMLPDTINLLFQIYSRIWTETSGCNAFEHIWFPLQTHACLTVPLYWALLIYLMLLFVFFWTQQLQMNIKPQWLAVVMKCSVRKMWVCFCHQIWLEMGKFDDI